MADETAYALLQWRKRELTAQIAAIKGQLAPKEAELVQIEKALTILEPPPDYVSPEAALKSFLDNTSGAADAKRSIDPKYANMTIKELVIQALIDHFPKGGTMMEIRDFIRLGYGRTIEPSSLRPQMHRLKAAGILGQDPSTDTWNFRDGKRSLYAMYDHPTSRAAMKELKDDPPENSARRTIAGGAGLDE